MKTTLLAALGFAFTLASANAQSSFEVASVRPVQPKDVHTYGVEITPGARLLIEGLPLKSLVAVAFRLSPWQVSGGEAWMEKDFFRVEAKPPQDLVPVLTNQRHSWLEIEDERLRAMMQNLLIERFHLEFRRENKAGAIYLLEKSGKPIPMRPSQFPARGESAWSVGYVGGQFSLFNTSMQQFAKFAANYYLHTPVVDRTELTGIYDYRQRTPDVDPNYSDNTDSFLRFIAELGLKLERTRGPVETFIIDHAEKPSVN